MRDLNIRPAHLKILQENIENTLENIGIGNYFLTMSPVGQDINTITDK
jgi:hypothetical protein